MAPDRDEGLSQIAMQAQNYQQQGQLLQQQLATIQMTISEVGNTLGTLNGFDKAKGNEVLLPIGSGTHVSAKLANTETVLINIGSDIIAEKPVAEAIELLNDRLKRLEETRDKVQQALLEISNRLEKLDSDAKQILAKKGAK